MKLESKCEVCHALGLVYDPCQRSHSTSCFSCEVMLSMQTVHGFLFPVRTEESKLYMMSGSEEPLKADSSSEIIVFITPTLSLFLIHYFILSLYCSHKPSRIHIFSPASAFHSTLIQCIRCRTVCYKVVFYIYIYINTIY